METGDKKVKIKCEACGQILSVPAKKTQIEVTCPKCKRKFIHPKSNPKTGLISPKGRQFLGQANKLADTLYKRLLWAFGTCALALLLFSIVSNFLSYRRACDDIVQSSEATVSRLETSLRVNEPNSWRACFIDGAKVQGEDPSSGTTLAIYKEISDASTKQRIGKDSNESTKCSVVVSSHSGGTLQGRLDFVLENSMTKKSAVLASYAVGFEISNASGGLGYEALITRLTAIH